MRHLAIIVFLSIVAPLAYAIDPSCCRDMSGVQYCDTSAGHYVCGNGYYSSCYCTEQAIMDLQNASGCCIWKGGVFKVDLETQLVICNDGGITVACSLERPSDKIISLW